MHGALLRKRFRKGKPETGLFLFLAKKTDIVMKPTKGVIMSILATFINTAAAGLVIRNDKDAINVLIGIIENSDPELSDMDKAFVAYIKAGQHQSL
jgi:hypothetical protein